jgi:transcriptional regulator with XRE-family HTH domain
MLSKEQFRSALGTRIDTLIRQNDLSGQDVSLSMKWGTEAGSGTVVGWRKGEVIPQTYTLCLLAENFDVSVDYLLLHRDAPGSSLGSYDVKQMFEEFKKWANDAGLSIEEAEDFIGMNHITHSFFQRIKDDPGADTSSWHAYLIAKGMSKKPSDLLHLDWRDTDIVGLDQISSGGITPRVGE